jgi:CubicO group peptidase (beta-lactamase class C family)
MKFQFDSRPTLVVVKRSVHNSLLHCSWRHYCLLIVAVVLLTLPAAAGSGLSLDDLLAVDYTPLPGNDWAVSTPETQGLDPLLVAEMYYRAARLKTIYSLLVIKDGYLIAEEYFHNGSVGQKDRLQSVTKSYTSALVGIALDRGYLTSVDQKMMDFFPELAGQITDARKEQITIREMLQMRAGYPWEESTPELFEMLYHGFQPSLLAEVPLVSDPGTRCEYSSLTSHLLGVIVARATGTDLKSFAEEYLFSPLNIEVGDWVQDWEGYYNGHADLFLSARDMAKFGLLYLNNGQYDGNQIISAQWVHDSLQTYSEDAWPYRVGRNFNDIGYGYQWWSVRAGCHHYNLAWGHGGQQIALLDEFDMAIVVTADPLFGQHGAGPGNSKNRISIWWPISLLPYRVSDALPGQNYAQAPRGACRRASGQPETTVTRKH